MDPLAYATRLATVTWQTMASDSQHYGSWETASPHGDTSSRWPRNLVQGSEDAERTGHGGDQEQRRRLGKRLRIQATAHFCHEEQEAAAFAQAEEKHGLHTQKGGQEKHPDLDRQAALPNHMGQR